MYATPVSKVALQPAAKTTLEAAVLKTVAYGDVFDYPLTAAEICRYLIGVVSVPATVTDVLSNGCLVPYYLSCAEGYFTLPGREQIVATRRRREAVAKGLWSEAGGYGRAIANLPFVRMVAVTGSLAVNNVEPDADIDYLIVTENERLWLARALVIVVVRLAARRNVRLCPNYFLSRRALVFAERNLYTAHELVQMRPIAGVDVYDQLRRLNGWTADFLPNAHVQHVAPAAAEPAQPRWWRVAEAVLRTPIGAPIEQWEMGRKIRKFNYWHNDENDNGGEATFAADWCKGHFDGHGRRIMARFAERIQSLEIGD